MTESFIIEVCATLERLSKLFSPRCGIDDKNNIFEIHYFSLITEILIHSKDLTIKLDKLGNRIDFKDDISATDNYTDITSLVAHFRDAACHNDSNRRRTATGQLFANNVSASDDFPDEITILMGDSKLFVKRHLVRLYREILKRFSEYSELHDNSNYRQAISYAKAFGHFTQTP